MTCKGSFSNGKLQANVETGSGHPGHIFSGSSGSDPVYKLSGSDRRPGLDHVRNEIVSLTRGKLINAIA